MQMYAPDMVLVQHRIRVLVLQILLRQTAPHQSVEVQVLPAYLYALVTGHAHSQMNVYAQQGMQV